MSNDGPQFTVTVTEDATLSEWVVTRHVSCSAAELCEMATVAANEVKRIHDEHHTNMLRSN